MVEILAGQLLQMLNDTSIENRPILLVMTKDHCTIASILSVWKLGGYFIPLSKQSLSQMESIVATASPSAILTNLSDIQCSHCPVLHIDPKQLVSQSRGMTPWSQRKCSATKYAYAMYTSGTSSGKPKECRVTHKALCLMANAWRTSYKLDTFSVRLYQWAPFTFDVFMGDFIRSLISVQGTMIFCPDHLRLDVPYIVKELQAESINIMEVTPQFAMELVQFSTKQTFEKFKLLIVGSDLLQWSNYEKICQHFSANQRVVNSYGMTEATIDSSYFEGTCVETESGCVPVGKPLPGIFYCIVDSTTLSPVPVGTQGELCIGGEILADGDVVHTTLDLKFLRNRRVLRTGDKARWLRSGDVELYGRIDSMKKIRGFRINTNEIAKAIEDRVPNVERAYVLVLTDKCILCAFLIMKANTVLSTDGSIAAYVSSYLDGSIPDYMIPQLVQTVTKLPLSSHGKIDEKALIEYISSDTVDHRSDLCSVPQILTKTEEILRSLYAEVLMKSENDIKLTVPFMDQGGHSIGIVRLKMLITQKTHFELSISNLFSFTTVKALAAFIDKGTSVVKSEVIQTTSATSLPVSTEAKIPLAIVGLGMRLPSSITSLAEFWRILDDGECLSNDFPSHRTTDILECIHPLKASQLEECSMYQGAFLDRIDLFDNEFFNIPPAEAKSMLPEQRLFMETATEALVDAGLINVIKNSRTGVFVGVTEPQYDKLSHSDDPIAIAGLMTSMIPTRLSYYFNLSGPTMVIDTACSSSLVALQKACESIQNKECERAIIGGISLTFYPERSGVFGKSSILSKDFICRPFDGKANGTASGEGILCLIVESYESAMQRKHPIYCVIDGISSNSVGKGNGITAPTSVSQEQLIRQSMSKANMDNVNEISYIEAHGTGTKLGDAIELDALRSVFSTRTSPLIIGSIKSNFGHTDAAAGLLGLFKVLVSIMRKQLPRTANFVEPHEELLKHECLTVLKRTETWLHPRRAGVSSFGLSGTNCHAIVSESPTSFTLTRRNSIPKEQTYPLLLSGGNLLLFQRQAILYLEYIKHFVVDAVHGPNITDFCYTCALRLKSAFECGMKSEVRVVILVDSKQTVMNILHQTVQLDSIQALQLLANSYPNNIFLSKNDPTATTTAFTTYLEEQKVNIDTLFPTLKTHVKQLSGVPTVLFNSKRFWVEKTKSMQSNALYSGNIALLLNKQLTNVRELVQTINLEPSTEYKICINEFCASLILTFFSTTKLKQHWKTNNTVDFDWFFTLTKMHSKYRKLFFIMIRQLKESSIIKSMDEEFKEFSILKEFDCVESPATIAEYGIKTFPAYADCFRFPLYCSKYYSDVLCLAMSPLSVIYPKGDMEFMSKFNKLGDQLGDVYYNMYMQLIVQYCQNRVLLGHSIRILEVGAGVGHVTRQLVPKLASISEQKIEYWFTDLGKAFVENARKNLFNDYSTMMHYSVFDITKSPLEQNLYGKFDIIVSYNVIHTTESIKKSVINLKSCLTETDGLLVIIESAKNETWSTLAWGLLDGWWYFKDYDLRPSDPMLNVDTWLRVLSECGFTSVYTCPEKEDEKSFVEKCLFICTMGSSKCHTAINETTAPFQLDLPKTVDPITLSSEKNIMLSTAEVNNAQCIEEYLKKIWINLLEIQEVDLDQDFFSLGGESLLAIQMMHDVQKRLGYELEIADTFAHTTVRKLAKFIYNQLHGKVEVINEVDVSFPLCARQSVHGSSMLLFPGQGAQKVGMGKTMQSSLKAIQVFKTAEDLLGFTILDVCLSGQPVQRFQSTEFVQVALFCCSVAKFEELREQEPHLLENVNCVAGLSVGEFAALVFTKALTFENGLRLVYERAKIMENEVHKYATGMVSVFGPSLNDLEMCMTTSSSSLQISAYLADDQHSIGGPLDECEAFVRDKKQLYKDVRQLRVAGAFHTEYMRDAGEQFSGILAKTQISEPELPIYLNYTGKCSKDPATIKNELHLQLSAPVQWKMLIENAVENGIRHFIEVSPARVLSTLIKRIGKCKEHNCTAEWKQV